MKRKNISSQKERNGVVCIPGFFTSQKETKCPFKLITISFIFLWLLTGWKTIGILSGPTPVVTVNNGNCIPTRTMANSQFRLIIRYAGIFQPGFIITLE